MTVRTKTDIARLKNALWRLAALTDEDNPLCAVRGSHKKAVRPYVETWVIPELRALLPKDERK